MEEPEKRHNPSIGADEARQEREWLFAFLATVNKLRLYPAEHSQARQGLQDFYDLTVQLQSEGSGEITLTCTQDSALINHFVIDSAVPAFHRVGEDLRDRNIHTLVFDTGLKWEELAGFVSIFARPVERILEEGGVEFLLEDAGIDHIRLAHLRYAQSAEDDRDAMEFQEARETDQMRLLFARVDEVGLPGLGGSSGGGNLPDNVDVAALMENPKITALFLDQKVRGPSEDVVHGHALAQALEKLSVLAWQSDRRQWSGFCDKLVDAMLLLPARSRGRILEAMHDEISEDVPLLDDVMDCLSVEQLATLIVDYLESRQSEEGPQPAPEDGRQVSSVIRDLIKTPDQFDILAPLLSSELKHRGINMQESQGYFGDLGHLLGDREGDGRKLEATVDKLLIGKNLPTIAEEDSTLLEEFAWTLRPDPIQENRQKQVEELLRLEKEAEIYAHVLGPEHLDAIQHLIDAEEWEEARGMLDVFLEHARLQQGEIFAGRSAMARSFIEELDAYILIQLYLPELLDASVSRFPKDMYLAAEALLDVRSPALAQEVLFLLLDADLTRQDRERMRALFAKYWEHLMPGLLHWVDSREDFFTPAFELLLMTACDDDALPLMEHLLHLGRDDLAEKVTQATAGIGTPESYNLLVRFAPGKGPLPQAAAKALRESHCPQSVPLLEKDLFAPNLLGLQTYRKQKALEDLFLCDHLSARRVVQRFLLKSPALPGRSAHRKLTLWAMDRLMGWPRSEARSLLEKLQEHNDRAIREKASAIVGGLSKAGKGAGKGAK